MIISINKITSEDFPIVGGKAANLSKLIFLGYNVPKGFCISIKIYNKFLDITNLNHKINTELNKSNMDTMRWEELWDISLRIRNFFNTTFLPEEIEDLLLKKLKDWNYPVVVRSSAPGEDSSYSSFAGLHDSYIDIKKETDVLEKIKLVWSSLWSDSALLYRKELDLNIYKSSMGVIVQEMISGEVSGIAFSKNPLNKEEKIIIEAVEGLNQKLVNGETEPCRWVINKKSNKIESITESRESSSALLDKTNIEYLSSLLKKLEKEFNFPIDLEWTLKDGIFYLLQVRPITTISKNTGDEKPWEVGDKRPWYKSLTLTFKALEKMKIYIDEDIFPKMKKVAIQFKDTRLESMNEKELNIEIKDFLKKYETSTFKGEKIFTNNHEFIDFLLNSSKGFNKRTSSSPKKLEEEFLSKFISLDGKKILEIARASWKFRDDDNLYLGKIEAGVLEAFNLKKEKFYLNKEIEHHFMDFTSKKNYKGSEITLRRFTGQPASPGIGSGNARIISSSKDIFHFKKGEILICDSLDPNMTFIVPLASAIIESRGGMLIHGAIIAREYGIPCVTGVGKASESIKSGDYIIVDGYLGTVSINDI